MFESRGYRIPVLPIKEPENKKVNCGQLDSVKSRSCRYLAGVAVLVSMRLKGQFFYTDDLMLPRGRVLDSTFAVLKKHLTGEKILELTYTTLHL